jgi:hypothetical protein
MDQATHNKIVSFIWGIADDVLRDLFRRGKYPDVIRYVCRRDRFKSNFTRRQVRKKVTAIAATVVNCDSIISLPRERILKLRYKGTVSMWHEGFLNCV